MAHPQIARAQIKGKPFTLYFDYDQLRDHKLSQLIEDEKIEWFRLRMNYVFLEPLTRLFQGKTQAYRELNSIKENDLPARSFVIASFSVLLNGIEALGSFMTAPPNAGKRTNFYAFMTAYMRSWDVKIPQSLYSPKDDLKEILWMHFRNGIAHGFCIEGGGIDDEADTAPGGWQVVNGRLQVGPHAFFKDFVAGVNSFFKEVETIHRINFLQRFRDVYPHLRPRFGRSVLRCHTSDSAS